MRRHLVMYNARSGSTVVNNHIAANVCNPPFLIYEHDLPSSEIHDDEYMMYFKKLIAINNNYPNMEWVMKYHIMCGLRNNMKLQGRNRNPKRLYKFNFMHVHQFLQGLGVTDLHFSFRNDIVDTMCSFLIAENSGNWVVSNREKAKYEPFSVSSKQITHLIKIFDLSYQAYSRTVLEMKPKYVCHFYPYEKLHELLDIDNDPYGLTKQLSKEDKKKLIINYSEVEKRIKESKIFRPHYDETTGVFWLDD